MERKTDKLKKDRWNVEQWSARWAHNPKVVGSNPTVPTIYGVVV